MDFINVNDIFQEGIPSGGSSLMMHEHSKHHRHGYRVGAEAPSEMQISATHESAWGQWANTVVLPTIPAENDPRPHMDVLQERRSRRIYDNRPYTLFDLLRLLRLIGRIDEPNDVQSAPYNSLHKWQRKLTLVHPIVIAKDVEGLETGAYRYDLNTRQLHIIRQEDPQSIVNYTYYQAEFTEAPLIILLCASLSQAISLYGDRGYRYILMEGGMLLQQLYLASSYLMLSGSTSGSFTQDDFHEWLGFDGYNQAIITSFVIGHMPESAASQPVNGEES